MVCSNFGFAIVSFLLILAVGFNTVEAFSQQLAIRYKRYHPTSSSSRLYAEETKDEQRQSTYSSGSSRRGFLNTCCIVAASVACSSVSSSSANAQSPSSNTDVNVQSIDESNSSIIKPIIESSPQQTLLSTNDESSSDNSNSNSITAFQESISGFVSGAAVSSVKTLVKYPLDTATVRLQMPNTEYAISNLRKLFSGSFDGITAPLLSNIPAGAIFFAIKDATKTSLKGLDIPLPKWVLTSLAVSAALPPYWALRNPSEVVKTRLQVGADGYYEGMSTLDAFKLALSNDDDNSTTGGVSELYQGYSENILYGLPADVIKFVAYDNFTGGKGKRDISPIDGAICGAAATAIAQLVTTPLDVLRNRIMAEVSNDNEDEVSSSKDLSYIDRIVKISREEGIEELFAGSTPRIAKACLSGAIQFATYEETKQKMAQFFIKR